MYGGGGSVCVCVYKGGGRLCAIERRGVCGRGRVPCVGVREVLGSKFNVGRTRLGSHPQVESRFSSSSRKSSVH